MGRWKAQSKHRKVETKESGWEGGNNRVTTGRWKLQIDHRKMETTESPWKMSTRE